MSTLGGEEYLNPRITLTGREYLRKLQSEHEAAVDELLAVLDKLRAIMTTVATSNYPIDDANDEYQKLYRSADAQLRRMGIAHTNPYRSLWDWRARWKSGDLPSYQSRRDFLDKSSTPLMQQVSGNVGSSIPPASLTSGVPGRTQESPPPTPSTQSLPVVQEVPQPLAKLTGSRSSSFAMCL